MTTPDPRNWAALARAVRERRQELKLGSQKRVADQAGVSLNTWGRLEAGTPVSMETVAQAAQILQWDESVPLEILASRDATARPETVRASTRVPSGSAGDQLARSVQGMAQSSQGGVLIMTTRMEAPAEVMTPGGRGYLFVASPIPDDVMAELDHEDVERLAETLRKHGVELAHTIVQAKRRARAATQEGRGDEHTEP
jgi:transcriptional regulator with XRE-family HTH domain